MHRAQVTKNSTQPDTLALWQTTLALGLTEADESHPFKLEACARRGIHQYGRKYVRMHFPSVVSTVLTPGARELC